MAFKRMEDYAGSVPQKFIDNRVPKCPMCGTDNPRWAIDEKAEVKSYKRYLFRCEQCECILSATVYDITGIARIPLNSVALAKALSGKKIGTIYITIDDVGSMQATKVHQGKEVSLREINEMANQI